MIGGKRRNTGWNTYHPSPASLPLTSPPGGKKAPPGVVFLPPLPHLCALLPRERPPLTWVLWCERHMTPSRTRLMATSRTGTTKWLRLARQAKQRAQSQGLTHCPLCGTLLNYRVGRTPASAEADHVVPYSRGGTDCADNIRIICRRCNQRRGNGLRPPSPGGGGRGVQATRITQTSSTDTW